MRGAFCLFLIAVFFFHKIYLYVELLFPSDMDTMDYVWLVHFNRTVCMHTCIHACRSVLVPIGFYAVFLLHMFHLPVMYIVYSPWWCSWCVLLLILHMIRYDSSLLLFSIQLNQHKCMHWVQMHSLASFQYTINNFITHSKLRIYIITVWDSNIYMKCVAQ